MDSEVICRLLPEEPPKGLVSWVCTKYPDDLGINLMIVSSERRERGLNWETLMCDNMIVGKKEWAAVCTCSACAEEFVTSKLPGLDVFNMMDGPDGQMYPWWDEPIRDDYYTDCQVIQVSALDEIVCPFCGARDKVCFAKHLRGGRTKRMQIAAWCQVGEYGGLCYWLVENRIGPCGSEGIRAVPREAFLMTDTGDFIHFSHRTNGYMGIDRDLGRWRPMKSNHDTWDKRFSDWGSINNIKVGCDVYPYGFDTAGTTMEKTGLKEFAEAEGWPPVRYLRLWCKVKGVENLVKAGHVELVKDIVRTAWKFEQNEKTEAEKCLDVTRAKPHEMLGMTRAEYRTVKQQNVQLTADLMVQWRKYRKLGRSFEAFLEDRKRYGSQIDVAVEIALRDGSSMDRITQYLEKQNLKYTSVYLLNDTRKNYIRFAGDRKLTDEELWPRNLNRAHDAVAEQVMLLDSKEKAEHFQVGFDKVLQKFRALEWTDGELCIRLPESWIDLQREGRVLRHCVGSFGKTHIDGSNTIFFVRRYRRPERPYYTLDINMNGIPEEVQLHGYGNERHGPNKEYTHRLEPKVRAFCDRWKEEVLIPFYLKQQSEHKEKTA